MNNYNYIDSHSHILFNVDDGAKDIEESIEIIKKLVNLGFKEIILTPHYKNAYHKDNKIKMIIFKELLKRVEKEQLDVKLHLANEVRISSNISELIEKDEITLLNNYLFLELPFSNKIYNLEKLVYDLQLNNINIILVHPERYNYFNKKNYKKLIEHDVMLQVNYESIIGTYGGKAKRNAKYLLKNRLVSFLGTDVHKEDAILFSKFDKISSKIIKLTSNRYYEDIVFNNISRILSK